MPDFYEIWLPEQIEHAIMNILIEIDEHDPKLQICQISSKTEMCSNLDEIWHLEQTEHVYYEYSAWN